MLIRPEQEKEFTKIYNLVKTTFSTAPVKDGSEQEYVNRLRQSNNYIPELALVVEDRGNIIGHIMLSSLMIQGESQQFESLLLAPVTIAVEYQNQKIGTTLIQDSLNRAKNMEYTSVIVVGNPKYYHRFGFDSALNFGINNPEGIESKYVMALALSDDGLKGKSGQITFNSF